MYDEKKCEDMYENNMLDQHITKTVIICNCLKSFIKVPNIVSRMATIEESIMIIFEKALK